MDYQQDLTREDGHRAHQRSGSRDQHRILDLDAEVFGDNLASVPHFTGTTAVRSVGDLGAGAGAGSRLLREQGFAVVEADLDDGFPALADSLITADTVAAAPVDLVWASSTLHHVAHPPGSCRGSAGHWRWVGCWSSSSSLMIRVLTDLGRRRRGR